MPNGDYLWRVNDHAKTRREIARHSKVDAEAYDEYGKAMVEMGRFVKPILTMTPPDPTTLEPRGLKDLLFLARRFQALLRRGQIQPDPVDDDERRRLPGPVVRDRRVEGDDVGLGNHRHLSGRPIAGDRLRPPSPLHGGNRRRLPLVGAVARRHRCDLGWPARRPHARQASRSAPTPRSRASSSRKARRWASCSRTATT